MNNSHLILNYISMLYWRNRLFNNLKLDRLANSCSINSYQGKSENHGRIKIYFKLIVKLIVRKFSCAKQKLNLIISISNYFSLLFFRKKCMEITLEGRLCNFSTFHFPLFTCILFLKFTPRVTVYWYFKMQGWHMTWIFKNDR